MYAIHIYINIYVGVRVCILYKQCCNHATRILSLSPLAMQHLNRQLVLKYICAGPWQLSGLRATPQRTLTYTHTHTNPDEDTLANQRSATGAAGWTRKLPFPATLRRLASELTMASSFKYNKLATLLVECRVRQFAAEVPATLHRVCKRGKEREGEGEGEMKWRCKSLCFSSALCVIPLKIDCILCAFKRFIHPLTGSSSTSFTSPSHTPPPPSLPSLLRQVLLFDFKRRLLVSLAFVAHSN